MRTGTYRIEPICVESGFAVGSFGDLYSPLATMLTHWVFPLGLNTILEELKVCARIQPARWLHIVVETAFWHSYQ